MAGPDIDGIAEICHEANRVYCELLGDESQDIWDEAPEWQRESARNGVEYAIAHPDVTPEQMHENWSREKLAAGWTYGEVKDPEAKTHHCLVPYAELPPAQRTKDHLFSAIVRALTAS